jgi:hypothetical protein
LGNAPAAHAQLLPLRLKIGIVNLTDAAAKNIAGTPAYTGEADFVLPSLGSGGSTILTAGIQERRSNGNELRIVPLTISRTSNLPNPAAVVTGNFYYGAGVGAYVMQAKVAGFSKDKTNFGGFGVVGYQFPLVGIFAEAKYQLVSGSVLGAHGSGVLLMIGKRL